MGEIRVLHAGSRGAYGAPRIHAALRRAGRVVNSKKIERLMRKHRIVGITRRRRRGLTRQAKRAVFAFDLIGRDFTAPRPGMRLVGDMTELSTLEGKLYLATCIGLAMREVVGWAMADHHRAELPVAALRMAAGRGGLEQGCVMHTDRGSEYTSDEFRCEIRKLCMRQSMGRVGSCYDNAAAESWFAILKAEIGTTLWETREAARADVSATSRSSTTAAGSVGTPTTSTSPRSKRDPCSGRTSSRQRKHPLSSSRGNFNPYQVVDAVDGRGDRDVVSRRSHRSGARSLSSPPGPRRASCPRTRCSVHRQGP